MRDSVLSGMTSMALLHMTHTPFWWAVVLYLPLAITLWLPLHWLYRQNRGQRP